MERPYTQSDIKGLTRGQIADRVALQKDRYQRLNGKRFNRSKTKMEHLVNELLHANSRFTTTAPLPSPLSPPQPGLLPESPLTPLACSPPPLPPTATAQAPSLEAPPPGTNVVPVPSVQGSMSKVSDKPKLGIKYPTTLQFGERDEPDNSEVLHFPHVDVFQDATITPDLLSQMNTFHPLTVFLIDKRLENSKRAFSIEVRSANGTPRGLKQGQWRVRTKDVVESLLNLKALFDGNIKLSSPHPSRPEYFLEFLICTTGKVNDAPITEDSLVASMLDSETMEYSIDIIVENVINLKQILRDLKGPTSAAQDLVEIQNRSKPEATEVTNPIQTSSSSASTSTLSRSAKGKRGGDNNPERTRAVAQLSINAQAKPGYKRFDEGRGRSLGNSYIVERWAFVADFLAEFNGKKCQKTGLTITKSMCRDGLAVGDTTFSEAVEGDRLVKTYGRGRHHEALEVAAILESDEVIGSVKLSNYLKQWKKDHS